MGQGHCREKATAHAPPPPSSPRAAAAVLPARRRCHPPRAPPRPSSPRRGRLVPRAPPRLSSHHKRVSFSHASMHFKACSASFRAFSASLSLCSRNSSGEFQEARPEDISSFSRFDPSTAESQSLVSASPPLITQYFTFPCGL